MDDTIQLPGGGTRPSVKAKDVITGAIALTGIKAIDKGLAELEATLQRKALRTALREAAKLVTYESKQRVPVQTGVLEKSIKSRSVAKRGGTRAQRRAMGVATVTSEGWFTGPAFYGGMVELGTKYQTPKRYLTKALWDNKYQVQKYFLRVLAQETKKYAKEVTRDSDRARRKARTV